MQCTFCDHPSKAIYKDGIDTPSTGVGPFACGNHWLGFIEPKAIDPVSLAMAKQLKEMLTDPDEQEQLDDEE